MRGTSKQGRRRLALSTLGFAAALTACAAQAATLTMYRDPGCGCCLAWADHMETGGSHDVTSKDRSDIAAIKQRLGVPQELWSCHTALADGYVIEGHVPRADIERLLAERPEGITGLAVAGMPLGSPGMEVGGRTQTYQVIAFSPAGQRVWATHN